MAPQRSYKSSISSKLHISHYIALTSRCQFTSLFTVLWNDGSERNELVILRTAEVANEKSRHLLQSYTLTGFDYSSSVNVSRSTQYIPHSRQENTRSSTAFTTKWKDLPWPIEAWRIGRNTQSNNRKQLKWNIFKLYTSIWSSLAYPTEVVPRWPYAE